MNKLSKLIKRLLVIARAPGVKYLIGLNLQAIQKVKGKPGPNDNPREFYQALPLKTILTIGNPHDKCKHSGACIS